MHLYHGKNFFGPKLDVKDNIRAEIESSEGLQYKNGTWSLLEEEYVSSTKSPDAVLGILMDRIEWKVLNAPQYFDSKVSIQLIGYAINVKLGDQVLKQIDITHLKEGWLKDYEKISE